jgi:hypothetical protein
MNETDFVYYSYLVRLSCSKVYVYVSFILDGLIPSGAGKNKCYNGPQGWAVAT